MSACGGLYPLDTGPVTPASIRGRYDGDDARPPADIFSKSNSTTNEFSEAC
jgi:hypothetical protein